MGPSRCFARWCKTWASQLRTLDRATPRRALSFVRYGIKVDSSGLLSSGEPGVQLTWMDAKVGDWVVTPRRGKPVEIQALWYNALCIMENLARKFGGRIGPEALPQYGVRGELELQPLLLE